MSYIRINCVLVVVDHDDVMSDIDNDLHIADTNNIINSDVIFLELPFGEKLSRIELLEGAIREFVKNDVAMDLACVNDAPDYALCEKWSVSKSKLRELVGE
jgi:hypothetical protein